MKLSELSIKQLRVKAVKAGMPEAGAKAFTTKKPLIETIKALRSKNDDGKKVNPNTTGNLTPKEAKATNTKWRDKAIKMGQHLEAQEKVGMVYPLSPGEKRGVVESHFDKKLKLRVFKHISGAVKEKIMNGYKWIMPKGIMTQVPLQIYEKLSQELQTEADLGTEFGVDRTDPKTGKPVSDKLS